MDINHIVYLIIQIVLTQIGKSGISTDKAIKVIANANTASLKDITCSSFIDGVNDPEDIFKI